MSDMSVATRTMIQDPTKDSRNRPYQPFGSAESIFYAKQPEVMYVGPSGTGKSRAILEKIHLCMSKYPGARALIVRKTRASLTQSGLVTFDKFVVPQNGSVVWRTGEQEYRYANGSVIAVGGLDKSIKIMSAEYDIIYPQEATELTEDDWETLTIRARFGVMPYNQVIGDCNPSYPGHWIKSKIDAGKIHAISAAHEDNPTLWDHMMRQWTQRGVNYIAKLDALTGVRKKRYRFGVWAAAEGQIYSEWDPNIHMKDRFRIPNGWKRYWVIDFGFTNPFVWQAWAIDPVYGTAYRFAEIYQTGLLVEDACALIKAWMRENEEVLPDNVICDWDAEDRATFERHMDTSTTAANKQVVNGIHSVKMRLKVREESGLPGIILMRDSLLEVDVNLVEAMKPTCTESEFESYEWENAKKKETPRKEDDHGMDDVRYLSVHLDTTTESWSRRMAS